MVLRGTNEPGQVTSRGGWRKATLDSSWENAEPGPGGGRLCPTCNDEVTVPPHSGQPRDWDINHDPPWSKREFPPDVTRKAVLDNYQEGTWLEPVLQQARGEPEMIDLVQHLEGHLGRMSSGWSRDATGKKLPFQVGLFDDGPIAGTGGLATLGISHEVLRLGAGARTGRQELVMLYRHGASYRNLPGILQQVGMRALHDKRCYLRGEVIGPNGPLTDGSRLEALYVAVPVYLPDSFQVFRPADGDPVVMAWLVPITAREARFVGEQGWEAFEHELQEEDPDLLDMTRESMDLPR